MIIASYMINVLIIYDDFLALGAMICCGTFFRGTVQCPGKAGNTNALTYIGFPSIFHVIRLYGNPVNGIPSAIENAVGHLFSAPGTLFVGYILHKYTSLQTKNALIPPMRDKGETSAVPLSLLMKSATRAFCNGNSR
jgi:hypothetical protein